jgi:peptide/nickel transport system permease protein
MSNHMTMTAASGPAAALSPGLWTLAWRRLRADKSAMVSMGVVLAFLLMCVV